MGYLFTLVFVILTHLSIDHVLPSLVAFRPMVVLSVFGILLSILAVPGAGSVLRSPAVPLFMAFYFFLPATRVLRGWLGGAYPALMDFLPAVVLFFLVLVNTTTAKRMKFLMLAMLCCSFYMSTRGIIQLRDGVGAGREADSEEKAAEFVMYHRNIVDRETWEIEEIARIRSTGFLSDPNDFAQYLLLVIPFAGLLHRRRAPFSNFILVWVPISFLLYAVFLTRSRGGALGTFVLFLLYIRDRVNAVASVIITSVAAFIGLGLQFGAGRAISIGGGSDRLAIWSDGLGMLKSSPLWGVGFRNFTETSKLTAHNSYLLAASELGIIGLFLWMGLIVYCVIYLNQLNKRYRAGLLDPEWAPLAPIIRLSFFSFLATAYFLSRTYSIDFYILLAFTVILVTRAIPDRSSETAAESAARTESAPVDPLNPPLQDGLAARLDLPFNTWFTYSTAATFGILLSIYTAVRMRSF